MGGGTSLVTAAAGPVQNPGESFSFLVFFLLSFILVLIPSVSHYDLLLSFHQLSQLFHPT